MSTPSCTGPSAGDLFGEAIRESLKIEEPAEVVNAFLETIRALRSVGDEEYATAMLPKTLIRIRELDDLRERAYLMRLFIELQCEMNRLDDMLGTLQLLDFDPEQRQSALKTAGVALAEAGRIDEARQLLDEIEDLDDDECVRKWIGTRLAEEKRFDEAFAEAEQIEPGVDQVVLLRNIAVEQWRTGAHPEAVETIRKALASARLVDEEPAHSLALSAAYDGLVVLHLIGEVMDTIRETTDLTVKTQNLHRLAFFLWKDGNAAGGRSLIDESLECARKIGDPFHRVEAMQHIGAVLDQMGDGDEATAVFRETQTAIQSVQNAYSRTKLFAEFAAWVARFGRDSAARRIFQFAIESAANIEEPILRVGMLATILELQAEAAFTDEALETLELLEECRKDFRDRRLATDPLDRTIAVAYGTLAAATQREELLQEGLSLTRQITDPVERVAALRRLALLRGKICS